MRIDSNHIKWLMVEQLMTQADLAEKCEVSRQSISAILARGTCAPKNVVKIAKALDVNADEILM